MPNRASAKAKRDGRRTSGPHADARPSSPPATEEPRAKPIAKKSASNKPSGNRSGNKAQSKSQSNRPSDSTTHAAQSSKASENDTLRAELTAAHARIAELEQSQRDILNRVDWVIDSLHNLPND